MPQARSPILERIGRALSAQFDETVHEPLPRRWVDLIDYLNDKERTEVDAPQPGTHRTVSLASLRDKPERWRRRVVHN